jgi:hypothetical protein
MNDVNPTSYSPAVEIVLITIGAISSISTLNPIHSQSFDTMLISYQKVVSITSD